MAGREFGAGGRLVSCFMMVYLHVVTSTDDPSEEAAKNDDSVTVLIQPVSETSREEPQAAAAEANDGKLKSVIRTMQEKDLGKAVIAIPIAIAMGTMAAGKDKLAHWEMNFILVLVCLGFTAILIGILFKETYPKFALTLEAVGILIVASSFFVIVAFLLPGVVAWIPLVCNFLCTVAFVIAIWQIIQS